MNSKGKNLEQGLPLYVGTNKKCQPTVKESFWMNCFLVQGEATVRQSCLVTSAACAESTFVIMID